MRKARIGLFVFIAVGIICVLVLLNRIFSAEILAFFHSLRFYIIIAFPFFFIIGIILFLIDKWSIVSTLSFACLIVFVFTGYSYFMTALATPASATPDANTGSGSYVLRIFIAEIVMILLLIAGLVKYFRDTALIPDSCQDEEDLLSDSFE